MRLKHTNFFKIIVNFSYTIENNFYFCRVMSIIIKKIYILISKYFVKSSLNSFKI